MDRDLLRSYVADFFIMQYADRIFGILFFLIWSFPLCSCQGAVSGFISDEAGRPIPNVRVSAEVSVKGKAGTPDEHRFANKLLVPTKVSSDGSFSVESPPGRTGNMMWIVATHPDYDATFLEILNWRKPQTIRIYLKLNQNIAFVRNLTSRPVEEQSIAILKNWLESLTDPSQFLIPSHVMKDVFPLIPRLRPYLLRLVSKRHVEGIANTARTRAMQLLSYWNDPDDEPIRQTWWSLFESQSPRELVAVSMRRSGSDVPLIDYFGFREQNIVWSLLGYNTPLEAAQQLNTDNSPYLVITPQHHVTGSSDRVLMEAAQFNPEKIRRNTMYSSFNVEMCRDVVVVRGNGRWRVSLVICKDQHPVQK